MPIEPQDGNWYVVTTCEDCQSTIILFRDLTNGTGSLNATYGVRCPKCQHKGHYEATHYYHAPSDPPSERSNVIGD